MQDESTIALVGNPNTGKSTIFNALTGLKQKIANYPGVTVERKVGYTTIDGERYRVVDLPGTYSLNPKAIDERIACDVLTGEYEHEPTPSLAIVVVDASNLDRNLFLATQVMDLGIPMIVVLNMMDVANERGIDIDVDRISKRLGIPVIPVVAKKSGEVDKLKSHIVRKDLQPTQPLAWQPSEALNEAIQIVIDEWIKPHTDLAERAWYIESLFLIGNDQLQDMVPDLQKQHTLRDVVCKARDVLEEAGANYAAEEVLRRYDFIERCTSKSVTREEETSDSLTDRIDSVVTHKVFGPLIFVGVLLVMFQAIFSWAEPFMNMIDLFFIESGHWVATHLPPGMLNDLLVEGVIAGLGGVVIFLPQILFLFFFISVLEGTGYMARAAFVMDGFMSRIGLHGRSVVPLMSGFACAVPGIMATRTIENWRDRIITIMVLPFMACSARLPVYALMIAAFIPSETYLGIFSLQGLTFFGLYLFGIVTAIVAARVMKAFFKSKEQTPFMMELPSYKMPKWSTVFRNVVDRGRIFVTEAGKIIMAISIVLWFLASFPRVDAPDTGTTASVPAQEVSTLAQSQPPASQMTEKQLAAYRLKHSYAGQFGQLIEPVIEPLGFDWKIGIGLITSFAAREVMVGTLNTIYSVQDQGDNTLTLQQKMLQETDEQGTPVYSVWTALSLMVFFALAMQCMSTIAIVKRETNSWRWPAIMFTYMSTLAYIASFIVYQLGTSF
ncbi:MAG: ferrous iron transport protein B [Bacteroidota bacterium]